MATVAWISTGGGALAPIIAQSKQNLTNGDNPTIALTFDNPVVNGNLVVFTVWTFIATGSEIPILSAGMLTKTGGTSTVGSVTLDASAERSQGTPDTNCGIYSVPVTGNGTLTLTLALGAGTGVYPAVVGAEVSSADVSGSRVAATSTVNTGNSASIVAGNVTTGGAGIIFGVCNQGSPYGTITLTKDAAFTSLGKLVNDTAGNGEVIYRTDAVNTTDSADWTISVASDLCACDVAYKSSAP